MKIVFLCHFSTNTIRGHLNLKSYTYRNIIRKWRGATPICYSDFALWVSDYITEFEKYDDIDVHIIAPHKGMKKDVQSFDIDNIHYHIVKCDGPIWQDVVNKRFNQQKKNKYATIRKRIRNITNSVNPDIVLLCGAENPYYSLAVLDVKDKPIYVILQTLLNDPKRIEMGVGTEYRRNVELEVFKHSGYFSTSDTKAIKTIKSVNSKAICLPSGFPTHRPYVPLDVEKESDFVFFSRIITKNKGIEDVLAALTIVKKEVPAVNLNIIGGCKPDYLPFLQNEVLRMGIQDNVHFLGFFQSIEETYAHVATGRAVVVPGITASLNSTVRESMLIGLPTICYETPGTKNINKEKRCLLTAPLNDIQGLAELMLFALNNEEKAHQIGINGKAYAEVVFSNAAIVRTLLENCKLIINNYYNHSPIDGGLLRHDI